MEQGRCGEDRTRGFRHRRSPGAGSHVLVGIVVSSLLIGAVGRAQTPPAPPAPATVALASPASPWRFTVRDMFRAESWQYFQPFPGGGGPDYTFAGNQLFVQVAFSKPRVDATVAVQHVSLTRLPDRATGPGALGTGALYFTQGNSRTHQQQLYLRFANVRLRRVAPGLDVRFGRQGYTSGAEAASSDPGIEAIKRQRLDARLVGEFEWSQYQRAYDGVRADWRHGALIVTGVAFMPTQGGFARKAGSTMTHLRVAGATAVLLPSAPRPHLELQGFVWHYDDTRDVTGRPDNTGLSALRADVSMTTVGGTAIGAWPVRSGRVDLLGWTAVQRGDWYGQDHSAVTFAAEGGHQWTRTWWTPWLRAGWFYASGDDDPADDQHETFFPLLPTVRRFSQTTAYSTMNLKDAFTTVQLRPAGALTIRADLRRLALASARDGWYAGSGATLSRGSNFGYTSRPSNGATRFGTAVELSAAYTVSPRWTLSGYAGTIAAGPVVTGTFQGDRLWFAYVENGVRIDLPGR